LLEAARAEDFCLSQSRQVKALAAPELTASDSVTGKGARQKARKAAYRRARTTASPDYPAPPQFEAFILLLLDACFRPLEALTLEWADVDEAAGTVSLQGFKNTPTRTFRINADTLALLQRLPRTSPRVFDLSYRALSASWRSICRRSELHPLRLTTLRHEGCAGPLNQAGSPRGNCGRFSDSGQSATCAIFCGLQTFSSPLPSARLAKQHNVARRPRPKAQCTALRRAWRRGSVWVACSAGQARRGPVLRRHVAPTKGSPALR
jgi:hypothetical protein